MKQGTTNQLINQSINQSTQCQSTNPRFQQAFNNFNKILAISTSFLLLAFKFLLVAKFLANFQ